MCVDLFNAYTTVKVPGDRYSVAPRQLRVLVWRTLHTHGLHDDRTDIHNPYTHTHIYIQASTNAKLMSLLCTW